MSKSAEDTTIKPNSLQSSSALSYDCGNSMINSRITTAPSDDSNPPGLKVSAISALNHDLLTEIFFLNANMDDDPDYWKINDDYPLYDRKSRALAVAWTTSQVCRSWRETIIESSMLWGRLVDVDLLFKVNPRWRDEIICRSGSSLLSIRGDMCDRQEAEKAFFLSLLDNHWPRVRKIDLVIPENYLLENQSWNIFFRPSRVLQMFKLRIDDEFENPHLDIPYLPSEGTGLFSDDAPQLLSFRLSTFRFGFSLQSSWLFQLRSFGLSYRPKFSMAELLDALEKMVHLESLSLHYAISTTEHITASFPRVRLPRLQEIDIRDYLLPSAIFLEHVTPHEGCLLDLSTSADHPVPTHTLELSMIHQVLSRYFRNWFNHTRITQLRLSLMYKAFSVSQHPRPGMDVPRFDVDIYSEDCAQLPIILPLLSAYSSCDLTNVTTLSFATNLFSEQTLDSNVQRFLLSLPSIETLETTFDGLKHLLPLPENTSGALEGYDDYICRPVFPLLRTVKINELTGQDLSSDASAVFLPFLTSRTHVGVPVQTLDLTGWKLFAKMGFLEEVEGLKVIWKKGEDVEEYVCGSGNAQRLLFES